MKLTRLRLGELLATVGAVALAVLSLRPWFQGPSGNLTAWDVFGVTDVLIVVDVLSALALFVATITERTAALPVAAAVWTIPIALITSIAILVRVLVKPDGATGHCPASWLALVASLAILAGAWLSIRDERTGRYRPDTSPRRAAPPA